MNARRSILVAFEPIEHIRRVHWQFKAETHRCRLKWVVSSPAILSVLFQRIARAHTRSPKNERMSVPAAFLGGAMEEQAVTVCHRE